MIRLAIIFFLISMIESEKCVFSIGQLNTIRNLFNDSESQMEDATQDQEENAAIVIGAARCGKSTLINYLMGNALEGYKYGVSRYAGLKMKQVNGNMTGPSIGAGSVSKTSIPSKWNSKRPELQNLDIWDTAGFADNRGEMQDLNNAFHLYHLTRKVENLKFILLIDFNDIQRDGTTPIENVLSILEKYFTNKYRSFFPSISVIISKALKTDELNNSINHTYISRKLQGKLLSNPKLAIRNISKDFIQHIIDNNQSFAIFRAAEKKGNLTSDIDVNIIPAIKSSKKLVKSCHQDVGIPYSDESEKCLRTCNNELFSIEAMTNFENILFKSFYDNFNAACHSNNSSTLQTNKAKLNRIYESFKTSLSNNPDAEEKIQLVEMIGANLKKYIKNNDLLNRISLIKFIDSILKTEIINTIDTPVDGLVLAVHLKISSLISLCSRNLNEITENEYLVQHQTDIDKREGLLKTVWNKIVQLNIPDKLSHLWKRFMNILQGFFS